MLQKKSKIIALFCFVGGLLLLLFVLIPIIKYEIESGNNLQTFLSPVPDQSLPDFTKPESWFEGDNEKDFAVSGKIVAYTLSIKTLRIENASVSIGGEDLSQSLIQYPGTALPGKKGNAVIFGHSILPQFYNPKSYLSIFSLLPTIKKDEVIKIDYDGVTYRYKVEDKFEVLPTDLQVLEQYNDDSYLTLVTCVPPGHPLRPKRLIVRARIIKSTGEKINEFTRS